MFRPGMPFAWIPSPQVTFGTPPRLSIPRACSSRLPIHLQHIARGGIDNTTKAQYDALFPYWLRCDKNMASNRQVRALAHNSLAANNSGALRAAMCSRLHGRATSPQCTLEVARRALYQFSFFGINSCRCATERLFEAQFGLRFGAAPTHRVVGKSRSDSSGSGEIKIPSAFSADYGRDAHKVAKITFNSLSSAERRLVRWLNGDDLLLYAEAKRLFHDRLRAYGIPRSARCS